MNLKNKNIVITGGNGGLGSEIAKQLAPYGCQLILVGRDETELNRVVREIDLGDGKALAVTADLLNPETRDNIGQNIINQIGQVDVLVNAAGLMSFRSFVEEDAKKVEQILQLNSIVPMLLTRQFLPAMIERGEGSIVNVGSTFGSIAFACFASYSASKFALRGFSEALRREVKGTGVSVNYIAPRAIKTPFNTEAVYKMAKVVGMNMDEPRWVAEKIVQSIKKEAKDVYLGFPEKLFVRINAILPRVVDKALAKQNKQMAEFARQE
ncbi:MAG: SDR family oxidoreductase [Gammaproteobacteria bacterium]|nr:SDR family oxidoreductase [Gammaproteobacteria bacterium]